MLDGTFALADRLLGGPVSCCSPLSSSSSLPHAAATSTQRESDGQRPCSMCLHVLPFVRCRCGAPVRRNTWLRRNASAHLSSARDVRRGRRRSRFCDVDDELRPGVEHHAVAACRHRGTARRAPCRRSRRRRDPRAVAGREDADLLGPDGDRAVAPDERHARPRPSSTFDVPTKPATNSLAGRS